MGMVAGAAMGGIMDVAASGMREQEARKQHNRNKDMADYMQDKQMDLWNKTNYEAQARHMKNAGLNIGLMYGTAGQGGQSNSVSGEGGKPNAPNPMANTAAMAGMGLQAGLTQAQIEATKAQTEKTRAEAEKISGVDTQEAKTRIADISQGIENKKAAEILTNVQSRLTSINADVADFSMEDAIKRINYEAEKAYHEVKSAQYEADLSEATYNDKIEIVKQEAIYQAAKVFLTKAQTGLTESQIEKIANDMKIDNRGMDVKEFEAYLKANNVNIQDVTGRGINEFIKLIDNLTGTERKDRKYDK